MSKDQIEAKMLAAAFEAAAAFGFNEAIKMLERAKTKLIDMQWNDRR